MCPCTDSFTESFRHYRRKDLTPLEYKKIYDFKWKEKNDPKNLEKVSEIAPCSSPKILSKDCRIYSIQDHQGFYIISSALSIRQQIDLSAKCLQEYSSNAATNLSNPSESICNKNKDLKSLWSNCLENKDVKGLKNLRWSTIGHHYDWTERKYSNKYTSQIPEKINDIALEAASLLGYKEGEFKCEAGIINFYPLGKTMGGHVDDAEYTMDKPIISISLGLSAIFLLGGKSKDTLPTPILLHSGDIVVLSGYSRYCFHAVPQIIANSLSSQLITEFSSQIDSKEDHSVSNLLLEYIKNSRININIRQVFP